VSKAEEKEEEKEEEKVVAENQRPPLINEA
jgi:hypothetical protein